MRIFVLFLLIFYFSPSYSQVDTVIYCNVSGPAGETIVSVSLFDVNDITCSRPIMTFKDSVKLDGSKKRVSVKVNGIPKNGTYILIMDNCDERHIENLACIWVTQTRLSTNEKLVFYKKDFNCE